MDLQTAQKIVNTERRLDALKMPEKSPDLNSPYLALGGLRAFWPMSAVDYTNPQVLDIAGGGYHLTNNNTATFGYDPTWTQAPCVFLNGTTQYLSRADGGAANWADITGTEAFIENTAVGARGISLGGWFRADVAPTGTNEFLISKRAAGNVAYYLLRLGANGRLQFGVHDGVNDFSVVSDVAYTLDQNTWTYVAGVFDPGVSVSVWRNMDITTSIVAPVASAQDSAEPFMIGARSNGAGGATLFFDGRASLCYLCAAKLDDATNSSTYQQTRGAFGV